MAFRYTDEELMRLDNICFCLDQEINDPDWDDPDYWRHCAEFLPPSEDADHCLEQADSLECGMLRGETL